MTIKIKHKRGSASAITSANPTLSAGELAFETDTRRFKVGDGTTAWSSLSYVTPYVTATNTLLGRSSSGAGAAEEIPCGSFGRSLISSADAAAARTTLSVQPTASPTFTGTVSAAAVTLSGVLLVTAGSASAPGVAISGDTNTGMYSPSADVLAWATNGAERVRVDASGNVGIGITPTQILDVYKASGTAMAKVTSAGTSGSDIARFSLVNGTVEYQSYAYAATGQTASGSISNHSYLLFTNNVTRITIGTDGSVTAPDVYGDTVGATNRDLFIDNTGKLGYVSSIRASKTNIESIDDVSWLRNLTPVSFHYRHRNEDGTYSDEPDGTLDYGLIAEEVEPVAPEMCFYDMVGGEPQLRGVHYSKLITPMLKYIQQLEARIAALEEKVNA